jgi:hypothetical protein
MLEYEVSTQRAGYAGYVFGTSRDIQGVPAAQRPRGTCAGVWSERMGFFALHIQAMWSVWQLC